MYLFPIPGSCCFTGPLCCLQQDRHGLLWRRGQIPPNHWPEGDGGYRGLARWYNFSLLESIIKDGHQTSYNENSLVGIDMYEWGYFLQGGTGSVTFGMDHWWRQISCGQGHFEPKSLSIHFEANFGDDKSTRSAATLEMDDMVLRCARRNGYFCPTTNLMIPMIIRYINVCIYIYTHVRTYIHMHILGQSIASEYTGGVFQRVCGCSPVEN